MIARFGGEEFALMVPHCPCSRAAQATGRACSQMRQQPLSREISLLCAPVSASSMSAVSMDEALSEADRQLYQAKNTGRDKIVCQDV